MVSRRVTPLKLAIFESGRTQADVAAEVELDVTTLNRIANGHVQPIAADKTKLAAALGKDVAELWPHESAEVAA